MRVTRSLVVLVCLALCGAPPAAAQQLAPPFDTAYSVQNIGPPPNVPGPFGGLTMKAGTTDRLLIGGSANQTNGALYEIGLVRDGEGHVVGFADDAARYADAPNNDGGVAYGPEGVLFLARYPLNQLGQLTPGNTVTDKVIELGPLGVAPSPGALTFVPAGHPGAGSLKLASYNAGQWYDAAVQPDGNGTYDLSRVTPIDGAVLAGPEGIVYVNPGSAEFARPSILVSEYNFGRVSAYEVNAEGDPAVSTRRDFVTGLTGAEGAFVDPVTGDFLFSTFGGSGGVVVVRGFARAATLSVVTEVVNDDGGQLRPEDFAVHVLSGGQDVAGSPQPGSAGGSLYTLTAGVEHRVAAEAMPRYSFSFSGDCSTDGVVTPVEGEQKTCVVTANDDAPTASLTVVTRVEGGAWLPADFTVHVLHGGADVTGSPQPGGDGSVYRLFAGPYRVAQAGARGYATTVGGACADDGTVRLEDGDAKTCTVVNRAVALGAGAVIETYGPSRTEGDYGLVEPNLDETRGYLLDPANFGPGGVVGQSLLIAPGIRAASERTLDGVDVLFTGWTPTASYSPAEKAALRAFVLAGGTLIATTDDSGHTMVDAFGLTQGDGSGNPTSNTITAPGHPIASGPFGVVTQFDQHFNTGHYPVLGPAREIGRNAQGTSLAVIERGSLGSGSGAAIFVADVDVFSFAGAATNATLIKNLFAFAVGAGPRDTTLPPSPPPPPPPPPAAQEELPPPVAGEEVNALPKSGTVRVRIAGTRRFVELEEGRQIPVGSTVDTTEGRVTIVAAGGQQADFFDGIFRLTQGKGARPLTTLALVEKLTCPKAGRAVAAARKKKRRLWGDGSGRFRTRGKHSAATVVGTRWLVEDRCASTLTRVTQGRVSVRDFVKKKTVTVRAGKKYVARAKG